MPSFPSYYLSDLERKRERSRQLREGLQSGMAGAFEGVDRLAQMQMALQGKATAGAEAKVKAEKEAEALAHGRSIEAANQARADQRFAWEGEDRARKMAREDAERSDEIADPDREAMMAGFDETLRGEGVEPTTSDILSKFRAAVENPAEATGRYAKEPGEARPEDVEGQTTSPEAGDILSRLKASMEEGAAPMQPSPPSAADKMDAARLRKMEADAAIAERKAKGGGGGVPGVTPKKEIDRQLAELRLKAAEAKAAGGGASTTDVDKVRKEFNALPAVKQYHDVTIAVDKMLTIVQDPDAAGDVSFVFNVHEDATIQGSTVREVEFATRATRPALRERRLNEYNSVS